IIGKVVEAKLKSVKPNSWNPNTMTPEQYASLRDGLIVDGWIRSQALLVWRTDENRKRKNIIIDGEHRWKGAVERGWTTAPMVFLDGLTEAQAKALTIKLDAKRGKFDETAIARLVQELNSQDVKVTDLGFSGEQLATLLNRELKPSASLEESVSHNNTVKMVPLHYTVDQHKRFLD